MAAAADRPLTVLLLASAGIDVLVRGFVRMALVALLYGVPVALALAGASFLLFAAVDEVRLSPGLIILGAFALLPTLMFLYGVVQLVAVDVALGRSRPVAGYGRQVAPTILPLTCLGLLAGAAVVAGFVLLVLPGLWIAAALMPLGPVLVDGRAGWAGLARAFELTRGYRWRIAGAWALLVLPVVIASEVLNYEAATGGILGLGPGGRGLLALLRVPIEVLRSALPIAFAAGVYAWLRAARDAAPAPELPVAA